MTEKGVFNLHVEDLKHIIHMLVNEVKTENK